jgi:hypothetical protein
MKKLEILNSEGPILILEKHKKHFLLHFNMEKYKMEITKEEIIDFITGKKIITSKGGEIYDYINEPDGMTRPTEIILEFLGF